MARNRKETLQLKCGKRGSNEVRKMGWWGQLISQVSSWDFHLGSWVKAKQITLYWLSGFKCLRYWCSWVPCPLEHRPWALESGRLGSKFNFTNYQGHDFGFCFLSSTHSPSIYCYFLCMVMFQYLFWIWTLFAGQGVNAVVSGSEEIRGNLGKGFEAVACYQPCRCILMVQYFNGVLSETKSSKEGTNL